MVNITEATKILQLRKENKMKKTLSLVLIVMILSSVLSLSVSARMFSPSYEKLVYDTNTYALARSASYTYTDIGYIESGSTQKSCRGVQGIDAANGYVSANAWVSGLAGTHVEVYIIGQASNEGIYSSNTKKCNMNSDCSTVYSGTGVILNATSVFNINYDCSVNGHSKNASYSAWTGRIQYK